MDKYEDHIVDYIEGTLSKDQVSAMEAEMQSNLSLREAVIAQQLVADALVYQQDEDLRKTFSTWGNELKKKDLATTEPRVKILSISGKWMSVAAAVLILVSAYFLFNQHPTRSDQLFTDNYTAPLPDINRDGTAAAPSILFAQGLDAYSKSNYESAINTLGQVAMDDPNFGDARLMLIDCYISSEEWDKASESAAQTINDKSRLNKVTLHRLEWVESLLLLKIGEQEKA